MEAAENLTAFTRIAEIKKEFHTNRFLSRKEVVPAFVERLREMADLASRGIAEYPGFLEVLAAQDASVKNKGGVVVEAINKMVGDPDDYAEPFLAGLLEGTVTAPNRKELTAAIGIMRLTADQIMEGEFKVDRAGYIARLASHWRAWPPQMEAALKKYTENQVKSYRQSVQTILERFTRVGRLAATGDKKVIDAEARTMRQARGNERSGKQNPRSRSSGAVIAETVGKKTPTEDVVTEAAASGSPSGN